MNAAPSEKKSKSIVLYFSYLPVLLLLIAVLGITSFARIKSLSTKNNEGSVLSKGSDSNSGDNEDNNDEDDNENENENEDNNDDGSDNKTATDGSNRTPLKTREVVINPDGTKTEIKKETKTDGRIKVETKTFDSEGNRLRVEKYEGEDGKEKSRITTYSATGTKLSDIQLETEDGKKLELRIKSGVSDLTRIRFDEDKNELIVKTDNDENDVNEISSSESELRLKLKGNDFVVSRKGVDALSKFPISIDDATGKIFVTTPVGEVELKSMPDTIVQKAQASDNIDEIDNVELSKQADSNQNDLEYTVTGTKTEKLLGLFTLKIPSSLIYDATTGDFVKNEQSFVAKILNLFSF